MTAQDQVDSIVNHYSSNQLRLQQFQAAVLAFFTNHPKFNEKQFPLIHSIKSRLKDPHHLRDKIIRKQKEGVFVTTENLFSTINDLIGVRVLHLYQDQFPLIHSELLSFIKEGDWSFMEEPKAMTWDPESEQMYKKLKIKTELRDSYYTSVHYVVMPNNKNPNPICCEIQVRTLFEEIWGEIDHSLNYPHPTTDVACKEQLRVLSKLVSTGTRLADSIFRTVNDRKGKDVKI
jgi:putative GTP pyrophosphokinase